jgi:hypothetical protein
MKIKHLLTGNIAVLIALGLVVWGLASASAQTSVVYAARMSSTSTSIWDPPFWWIASGGSAYGTSTAKSTAVGTPSGRAGSYWRSANTMSPGEGFGVVCTACGVGPGLVYAVDVTQPNSTISTNILFGVCSTNCMIGGLSGGAGYATNTTAFQDVYSVNKWGFVCWLTNSAGVSSPEIEFHYVSGGVGDSLKHYADCVRFTLVTASAGPTPVRITGMTGTALYYTGGSGTRFVLLKSASLSAALNSWQRADTNNLTPGTFTIPAVGNTAPVFYAIASE